MADDIDKACEREQLDREIAIAVARKYALAVDATGFCLECDAALTDKKRWCDKSCRDTWQRRNSKA